MGRVEVGCSCESAKRLSGKAFYRPNQIAIECEGIRRWPRGRLGCSVDQTLECTQQPPVCAHQPERDRPRNRRRAPLQREAACEIMGS